MNHSAFLKRASPSGMDIDTDCYLLHKKTLHTFWHEAFFYFKV